MGKKPTQLSKEEELKLVLIWQKRRSNKSKRALKARDTLIESQLAWVYKLALKFCRNQYCMEDVRLYYSEGCVRLIELLDNFNPDLGYRLTTYVGAIMWRRFLQVKNKEHVITLPYAYSEGWLDGKYKEKADKAKSVISINRPDGWKSDQDGRENSRLEYHLHRLRPSDHVIGTDELVARQELVDKVQHVISCLKSVNPDRDKDILLSRMAGETLQDVGDRHNISRERVRQIESRMKESFREAWIRMYKVPPTM